MTGPLYLDTSALAKLYIAERETPDVARWMQAQNQSIPFSRLHELELASAIERRAFAKDILRAAVKRIWRTIDLDLEQGVLRRVTIEWPEVFSDSIRLVRRHGGKGGLRGLDSMHVACALRLRSNAFVSFDRNQAQIAATEGLGTLP